MKNTLKLFSVIAIACSLLACAKEGQPETNNPAEPKDKKVTISFVADDAISVKTVLNNDNTASWAESGEYLRVFETAGQTVTSVKSNDSYTLENGKATFSATFDTNEDASSFVYNAVYPESSWVTENNNDLSALRLTTPAVQRPTLASYDPDADRLISKATEAVTEQGGQTLRLRFARLVSLFKMTITGLDTTDPVTSVSFTSAGKNLAGTSIVNLESGAMECESGNETVTLNYDRSAGFTNNSVAYFMTLPATIAIGEKFTVTVVTENAEGVATTYTKECTVEGKDIILPQGKSAQIGIDFTKPVEDVFTFTAATEKDTYAVGEAVNFTFGGNATAVEFWSGEWGKEYQYKDQKRMEIEALTLTFNASISGIIIRETGETRNCDRSLNISTDFTLNSEDPAGSITNATWTKLNANLSSSTDVAHSIDLTEYKTAPFSLGLQFKKTSTWTSTNKIRLYVKNVSLTAKLTNGRSIQIRGVSDFSTYNVSNNVFTNADTTNNYLYCMTDNSHTLNAESWLCTRRVIPCNNGIISITPDTGTVLTDLSSLTHTFTEAGTYTVTFVANSDIEGSEPIIITKTITVTK